jgi:hypothetical protein
VPFAARGAAPDADRRRVVGHDARDVRRAVAVVVADEEGDELVGADREFRFRAEARALERPDLEAALHERDDVGAVVADHVRDRERIRVRDEILHRNLALELERARAGLPKEGDRARLARIDDVHEAVLVEIDRHDAGDRMADAHVLAAEAPVLRQLVDAGGGGHFVGRLGAGLLVMQFEPALRVVRDHEVVQPVAVQVGNDERSRVGIDLDDFEAVEAEIAREIVGTGETGDGGDERADRERE